MLTNSEGISAFAEASSLTESAITITEMLNGNFSHVGNGMTLDISGMSGDQFKRVLKAAQSGNKNIKFVNQ